MSPPRPSKSRSCSELKTVKTIKAYKPGRITRNPFLNFLRDYRVSNKGLSITEVTQRGAEVWRSMNEQQKSTYFAMAKQAPIRTVRRRGRRRRGRRSRRRRRGDRQIEPYDSDDSYSDSEDDSMGEESRRDQNYSNEYKYKHPGTSDQQ